MKVVNPCSLDSGRGKHLIEREGKRRVSLSNETWVRDWDKRNIYLYFTFFFIVRE